jgi:hypothetical protein
VLNDILTSKAPCEAPPPAATPTACVTCGRQLAESDHIFRTCMACGQLAQQRAAIEARRWSARGDRNAWLLRVLIIVGLGIAVALFRYAKNRQIDEDDCIANGGKTWECHQ